MENIEDTFRTSNDAILPRPTSPAASFNSDDNEEHFYDSDNDENFYDDNDFAQNIDNRKKYYDINNELPGYMGNSGPYFPNLTTMWMFIWFTKNNIGNI